MWIVKWLAGFALAGLVAFEVGSPLVVRAQLDDAAHEAADTAAFELGRGATVDAARAAALAAVARKHAVMTGFTVDGVTRTVKVTMARDAQSVVLKRFGPTEGWYHVRASATAVPR